MEAPHFSVQLSEFFQDGDGNGDGGRRQDRPVEEVGKDVFKPEEEGGDQPAEEHGNKDAQRRDDDGGGARLLELFEVGRQPCREHDEHDADLAHDRKDEHHLVCKQDVLKGLPGDVFEEADEDAREQHADDGGHADAVCAEAHELAQAQDERKGKQDFKCLHSVFSLCRPLKRSSVVKGRRFFRKLL